MRSLCFLLVSAMAITTTSLASDENYFETWLQLREIRKFDKINDLLNKLTEEESVIAVKQTYDWLIEQKLKSSDKDYEGLASQAIRDFAHSYFKGSPERNPQPFLEMLKDSSMDNHFRLWLIKCLDREYDKERAYFQAVCNSLIEMIGNANEPLELRQEAESVISRLLGHQYHAVRMSQDELNRLKINELLSFPKEKISSETEKRITVLADNYNRYIGAVLSLAERDLTLYERLRYGVELSERKNHGFVTDPALIEALDNTVNKLTLSKDEFIEGTKQVTERIREQKNQDVKQPEDFGWGLIACGFVQYYFRSFPEESPKPFLQMASDKNNDEDFRKSMLDILSDNDFYTLKQKDIDTFSDSLISVAGDKENSNRIRKVALDCLQEQLGRLKTVEKENEQLLQKISVIRDKVINQRNTLLSKADMYSGKVETNASDFNDISKQKIMVEATVLHTEKELLDEFLKIDDSNVRTNILNDEQVEKLLGAIKNSTDSNVIHAPKLLVLDGETATVSVIKAITYIKDYLPAKDDKSKPEPITETVQAGIELNVTSEMMARSTCTGQGQIMLDVNMVSTDVEIKQFEKNGNIVGVPTIDSIQIITKVAIQDGQTIVLGGMTGAKGTEMITYDSGKSQKETIIDYKPKIEIVVLLKARKVD